MKWQLYLTQHRSTLGFAALAILSLCVLTSLVHDGAELYYLWHPSVRTKPHTIPLTVNTHLFSQKTLKLFGQSQTIAFSSLNATLQGIIANGDASSRKALIALDGQTKWYSVGEALTANATLKAISANAIWLNENGKTTQLRLANQPLQLDRPLTTGDLN